MRTKCDGGRTEEVTTCETDGTVTKRILNGGSELTVVGRGGGDNATGMMQGFRFAFLKLHDGNFYHVARGRDNELSILETSSRNKFDLQTNRGSVGTHYTDHFYKSVGFYSDPAVSAGVLGGMKKVFRSPSNNGMTMTKEDWNDESTGVKYSVTVFEEERKGILELLVSKDGIYGASIIRAEDGKIHAGLQGYDVCG